MAGGCGLRMPAATGPQPKSSIRAWTPKIQRTLYRGYVDLELGWKTRHFSGILLLNQQNDTTRLIFQHEMGVPFFAFQWNPNGEFEVLQIQKELDRDPMIEWIRLGLETWLFPYQAVQSEYLWTSIPKGESKDTLRWHRVDKGKIKVDYERGEPSMRRARIWDQGRWSRDIHWDYGPDAERSSLADRVRVEDAKQRIRITLEKINNHVVE